MLVNNAVLSISVIALLLQETESTCSSGQGWIDNVCTTCPSGTYANIWNNLCEKVPIGFYNPNVGSTGYFTCSSSVLPGAASCNSASNPIAIIAGSTSSVSGYSDGVGTNSLFSGPGDLTIDTVFGDIYVSDRSNNAIRKISSSIVVTTIVGSPLGTSGSGSNDGIGTNAKFNLPLGIRRNSVGDFYVMDLGNDRIRKITSNLEVSTLAGSSGGNQDGTGTNARFNNPSFVAVFSNEGLLVSEYNSKLRKVTLSGVVTTFSGPTSGTSSGYQDGVATNCRYGIPMGLDAEPTGNFIVADVINYRLRRVFTNGDCSTLAGSGVSVSADGVGTAASFGDVTGVVVSSDGIIYVSDYNNNKIRRVTSSGQVTTVKFTNANPQGMDLDSSGNLYIAETSRSRITRTRVSCYSGHFVAASGACSTVSTGYYSPFNNSGVYYYCPTANSSAMSSCSSCTLGHVVNYQCQACSAYQAGDGVNCYGLPSAQPSSQPSSQPSGQPSSQPSSQPSGQPTSQPSSQPSGQPSSHPSSQPSEHPSSHPSSLPSGQPSSQPSSQPSEHPSSHPSSLPSGQPSSHPSSQPSGQPSSKPSSHPPSSEPSSQPSGQPSSQPSSQPTLPSGIPTGQPTSRPSALPSALPSGQPSGLPSRVPSGQPTSTPTCITGYVHADADARGGGCAPCPKGYYVDSRDDRTCMPCPIGMYMPYEGRYGTCFSCNYPRYTRAKGQAQCPAVYLALTTRQALLGAFVLTFLLVVPPTITSGASPLGVTMNLLFPVFDVLSDVCYITSVTFYDPTILAFSVACLFYPMPFFLRRLVELKAWPRVLLIHPREIIWIGCSNSKSANGSTGDRCPYPTMRGNRIGLLPIQEHTNVGFLAYEFLVWCYAFVRQALSLIAWPMLTVLNLVVFLPIWFFFGVFLYATKILAVGNTWNLWFRVWTGHRKFDAVTENKEPVTIDTAELNKMIQNEFYFETLPQIAIQLTNNILLNRPWSIVGYFSFVFSIAMCVNGLYKYIYFRYFASEKLDYEKIPLDFTIDIKIDCLGIAWTIPAKLEPQSKSFHTGPSDSQQSLNSHDAVETIEEKDVELGCTSKSDSSLRSNADRIRSFLDQLDAVSTEYDDVAPPNHLLTSISAEELRELLGIVHHSLRCERSLNRGLQDTIAKLRKERKNIVTRIQQERAAPTEENEDISLRSRSVDDNYSEVLQDDEKEDSIKDLSEVYSESSRVKGQYQYPTIHFAPHDTASGLQIQSHTAKL